MACHHPQEALGAKGRISPAEPDIQASLCLRIKLSTIDPWVAQESPSSPSLSSLICTMHLIIATSRGKLLLVPGNFMGESSQVGGITLGVF